jgi:hypothetical protein
MVVVVIVGEFCILPRDTVVLALRNHLYRFVHCHRPGLKMFVYFKKEKDFVVMLCCTGVQKV